MLVKVISYNQQPLQQFLNILIIEMEDLRKKFPYFFLVMISLILIFIYICFVKLLVIDLHPFGNVLTVIFIVVYHIVLILLVWSIIEAIRRDPGKVPIQWGFGIENQTRKYCLICHVFKPQRTHHCSACSRCVLNMDHHCPWINTCIGFHNRKPFILMLIYTTLATFIDILTFAFSIPTLIQTLGEGDSSVIIKTIFITVAFILNTVIFVTIILFLKFHLQLIFSNTTTLQTLELKRQGKNPQDVASQYDIGNYYNWVQVFGRNSCTWFIPIFVSNEGPAGDGVLWPKKK